MPAHSSCSKHALARALQLLALLAFNAASGPAWADAPATSDARAATACIDVGAWFAPDAKAPRRLDSPAAIAAFSRRAVVLLGESHDNAEHHRWQLQTLAGLYALHPRMVIAFEMFPRRVQPALDRWVAGELGEHGLLAATDWHSVWDHDARLYLPLFNFARMNRIPMAAINVERALAHKVGEVGFDAVPAAEREGITAPAPPSDAYIDTLLSIYRQHQPDARRDAGRDDPQFRHFVEAQLLWDRAMAQGIAAALARAPGTLVVGVTGSGHVAHGYGIGHQLRALGVTDVAALLPWDRDRNCSELVPGIADAVFGVAAQPAELAARPRLGVILETTPEGVRIQKVEPESIAASAGLRAGDRIVAIAGRSVTRTMDVSAAVGRQAPGTWLPLNVERNGRTLEIVAKFPPSAH